jgi:glycosyltransferase involved in cell wall biosynthesis
MHVAKDPGSSDIVLPTEEEIKEYNITLSTWFEDKKDFEAVLSQANVFFTPRVEEGIGQSFLEAMARGQCVVAPNNGTMNEYIQDKYTGLLFDREDIRPLDFSDVIGIGERAYLSCELGYQTWLESHKDIVKYILMPNSEAYAGRYDYFSDCTRDVPEVPFKEEAIKRLRRRYKANRFARKIYHIYKSVSRQ